MPTRLFTLTFTAVVNGSEVTFTISSTDFGAITQILNDELVTSRSPRAQSYTITWREIRSEV